MKKVFVLSVQPEVGGPTFGRVMDPADIQKLQNFAHGHINQVVKDLLVAGAPGAEVAGFGATVASGLSVSVATGTAVDPLGISYESQDAASVATMAAAHVSLPRIDLIFATLEVDAAAETEFSAFRQLRTQAELEAGVDPYVPTQYSQPTELHTRTTIGVKTGVANASPTAPAVGDGEVALWQVHVAAGQTVLVNGDLTSVRVLMKSLYAVIQDVLALQALVTQGGLTEIVQDVVGAFIAASTSIVPTYNDAGNVESLALHSTYKDALDQATSANTASKLVKRDASGNFAAGPLLLNPTGPLVGGSSRQGVCAEGNAASEVEHVVMTLSPFPGSPAARFSIGNGFSQNSPRVRFYNSRGGAAGSDRVRFLNDEFGRWFFYGPFAILNDADGNSGSLSVAGAFTAGSKSFEIDHPGDPLNKDLRFASTESPNHGIESWGEVVLVAGSAVVNLDTAMGCSAGTFAALFVDSHVYLQNKTGYDAVKYTLAGNELTITCENGASTDTINWEIKGRRNDEMVKALPISDEDGRLIVEFAKLAPDESLMEAVTVITNAEEAAPDVVVEQVVPELVGTIGYPRHASLAPALGPAPTQEVTYQTNDMDGLEYVP